MLPASRLPLKRPDAWPLQAAALTSSCAGGPGRSRSAREGAGLPIYDRRGSSGVGAPRRAGSARGTAGELERAELASACHCSIARGDAELLVDRLRMRVNRVVGGEERRPDVALRDALGQVAQDFELPLGELALAVDPAMSRGQRARALLELDAHASGVGALREEEPRLLDEAPRGRERAAGRS